MFQKKDPKTAIEWASKALDSANSNEVENDLRNKRESVVLNSSRLLGTH